MRKNIIILFLIFLPIFSFGQISLPEGIREQISIDFSNNHPNPNEFVSVKISSYSTNLNKTDISWSINNVVQKREVGATSFSFQVGDFGSSTKLDIKIIKTDGGIISRTFTFRPMEVDLMYETNTTVPINYSGKALFSNQSAVRIFAEPRILDENGTTIPKEKLIYKWKINDFVHSEFSGIGKDYVYYGGSLITRPLKVSVEVSTLDSNIYGVKTIIIEPVEPYVLIYENNPALGTIFEQSIKNNFELSRPEIELFAQDIYFTKNSKINRKWYINSEEIFSSENLNTIIFRNENNEKGIATIRTTSQNNEKLLQGNSTFFNLVFKNN